MMYFSLSDTVFGNLMKSNETLRNKKEQKGVSCVLIISDNLITGKHI